MIGTPAKLGGQPRCPFCGAVSDGFTAVSDQEAKPAAGDVAVCLYCCEVHIYDGGPKGIMLRRPSPEEAAEFAADPEIMHAREITRAVRDRGGFLSRRRIQ